MIHRPIYELLPYLYFSIGLAAATNVSPSFGRASGVILALIGITIWRMRRNYRKEWK